LSAGSKASAGGTGGIFDSESSEVNFSILHP